MDVCEGPEDAIKREFMEETNLVVESKGIIKFYTRLLGEFNQPHTSVHILYHCVCLSGKIKKSHESLEIEYVDHTTIKDWHKDHEVWAKEAFEYWRKNY